MKTVDNKFMSTSKIVLYLLPLLGVTGITIPFIIGQSNLSLLGTYLAVPMILSSIIYFIQKNSEANFIILNHKLFPLFVSLYFIFISISIYLLHKYDVRQIVYYLTISVASSLILLEILLFDISKKEEVAILLQIAILVVDIIWGVTLNYNLFIGRTDIIVHFWLIQNLINNAHVTEIFDVYKSFPLWHILCAFLYKVLGIQLSIQKIMSITSGLIYSFVPIGTYLVSIRIFNDQKTSLLSALFVSIYPDVLFYGMYSISRSVVSFLEIILVLFLIDANNSKKVFLYIVLSISLIIYHTASMPFILSIISIILILNIFYSQKNNKFIFPLDLLSLALTMTLFYWVYYAPILLYNIVNNIVMPAPVGVLTESIIFTPLNELFNYLQYSPLLLFVIIGFFVAMNSKRMSTLGKIFCVVGLLAIPITFPGPSLLFNKLSSNFNFARFGEYTFLFIGLTGAVGFNEIYQKSKKYVKIFPIILFLIMAFLSVSNDFTASDNPLVKRPFYTFYLTDEEEITFEHVASIAQGYVMSDFVTDRYLFSSEYVNKTHILEVNNENTKFLKNQTIDLFLIRNMELSKRPLRLYSTSSESFISEASGPDNYNYYSKDEIVWVSLMAYNKVYDSKNVLGFN